MVETSISTKLRTIVLNDTIILAITHFRNEILDYVYVTNIVNFTNESSNVGYQIYVERPL